MLMLWDKLLSNKRLGAEKRNEHDYARDDFQRDYDRIVFSSAFRRLQDKTQVFPLSESDYIRKRLTHSLEASCVGRSLGHMVGIEIIRKYNLQDKFAPSHFGSIVASACVAHDIGNPPFGHSGEDAIRHWFLHGNGSSYIATFSGSKKSDFLEYEGNAQGFRLLTRLMHRHNNGGMQLTCATLAAFTKYPKCSCLSIPDLPDKDVSSKKHGFFDSERMHFQDVASEVGLLVRKDGEAWCRHPLAFLVEAADDICYGIIDLEDGVRLGYLPYDEAESVLLSVCAEADVQDRVKQIESQGKIEFLRAKALNALIHQAVNVFIANEENILAGNYKYSLLDQVDSNEAYKEVIKIDRSRVYTARPVIEIEAAGFDVIGGLLSAFVGAVEEIAKKGETSSKRSQKLRQLIPDQFIGSASTILDIDPYNRLLSVVDFVSGMTDSYAVSLFKKITGISLPHG